MTHKLVGAECHGNSRVFNGGVAIAGIDEAHIDFALLHGLNFGCGAFQQNEFNVVAIGKRANLQAGFAQPGLQRHVARFHAEAGNFFALEVFGLLVSILVFGECYALGAVQNSAADDDQVIALGDIRAGGDGAVRYYIDAALGKRGHDFGEAAAEGLLRYVELFLLVVAFFDGYGNA